MKNESAVKPISDKDLDVKGYQDSRVDQVFIIETKEDLRRFMETDHSKEWYGYFYNEMIHDKDLGFKDFFDRLFKLSEQFCSEKVRIIFVVGFEDVLQEAPLHDFRGAYSIHEIFMIESLDGSETKKFTKCVKYREF